MLSKWIFIEKIGHYHEFIFNSMKTSEQSALDNSLIPQCHRDMTLVSLHDFIFLFIVSANLLQ